LRKTARTEEEEEEEQEQSRRVVRLININAFSPKKEEEEIEERCYHRQSRDGSFQ